MGFVIAYKTVEQCVFPNETTQSGPSEPEGMRGIATLAHLSTAVAWREKEFKHFVFYQNFFWY